MPNQSDRFIRVCISQKSDCRIGVCISHYSDCRIRVLSRSNHSVFLQMMSWIIRLCKGVRKVFFSLLYPQDTRQTNYILSRTMKTTSKVQSEHNQSLHYMNIKQFFTCLNCMPSIKFNFATLDFAPSLVISL